MSDRAADLLLCAWPGLFQLWRRGNLAGLTLAIGFTALLNLLLVSSLVWTDFLSGSVRWAGWIAAVGTWSVAALVSYRATRRQPGTDASEMVEARRSLIDGLFTGAMDAYLKGHWHETERLLKKLLRRAPRDADAKLLLATTFRHTGRLDEAQRNLQELTRLEASEKWRVEIEQEIQQIEKRRAKDRPEQKDANEQQDTNEPDAEILETQLEPTTVAEVKWTRAA